MSDMSRDAFLDLLRKGLTRTRKTTVRRVEGKASEDGVAFVQEELHLLEPDLTTRSVNYIGTTTCDGGHIQDTQTRLVGRCSVCQAITCSVEGCHFTCTRCGRALCRRHAHVYGEGEAYCSGCRLPVLLRWIVLGKRR